jgi:prepilin-type N-terminal cleavage/methylation domain-containing protein
LGHQKKDERRIIMNKRRGFTLIELLVVIAIIAVLLSILMPALSKIKLQAQDAVDKNNQHEFALIWRYYTDDHDGCFAVRGSGSEAEDNGDPVLAMVRWEQCLIDYMPSLEREIIFCPAATKRWVDGGRWPYAAWTVDLADDLGGGTISGSYTVNLWAAVLSGDEPDEDRPKFYATPSTISASYAPILMCGNWKDCEPEPFDTVWQSQEEMVQEGVEWGTNEMKRVCHDRHGMLVNANFMDLAARKIGLKELWIIK